jgi:hypothetical protein
MIRSFVAHRLSSSELARLLQNAVQLWPQGGAEQFRLHPTPGSALNFVPAALLFLSYVVAPLAAVVAGPLVFAPLWALRAGCLPADAGLKSRARASRAACWQCRCWRPQTMFSMAWAYWRGLTTKLKAPGEAPKTDSHD